MTTPLSSVQLFFIYDSHCPWSYAATPLVNEIHNAYPQITVNLWHSAFFSSLNEINTVISKQEITDVEKIANITFSKNYLAMLGQNKDSTLSANILTWAQLKTSNLALPLLNALQQAHFNDGNTFETQEDFDSIITELKLSPPAKVFKTNQLSKDAEEIVQEIYALQDIIETKAIPALLLAIDDNLVLLNHNFYLTQPKAIVEAVRLELEKYS